MLSSSPLEIWTLVSFLQNQPQPCEQGQGHPFGDCREALWMGSPQIVDNYFVCLSKAGAAKMAPANKSVTY